MTHQFRMMRWLALALLTLSVVLSGCVTPTRAATFPGGITAWMKYLSSNIRAEIPVDEGAPGGRYRVMVRFVVDKEGRVSKTDAMNDPGYGMAREAVRVVRQSPNWQHAIENGRAVDSTHTQPVVFQIEAD